MKERFSFRADHAAIAELEVATRNLSEACRYCEVLSDSHREAIAAREPLVYAWRDAIFRAAGIEVRQTPSAGGSPRASFFFKSEAELIGPFSWFAMLKDGWVKLWAGPDDFCSYDWQLRAGTIGFVLFRVRGAGRGYGLDQYSMLNASTPHWHFGDDDNSMVNIMSQNPMTQIDKATESILKRLADCEKVWNAAKAEHKRIASAFVRDVAIAAGLKVAESGMDVQVFDGEDRLERFGTYCPARGEFILVARDGYDCCWTVDIFDVYDRGHGIFLIAQKRSNLRAFSGGNRDDE